ncbi:MAG: hypothetical protein ACFFE8_00345 [Candidatus Heimdallarchaeota archaeon]
MSSDTRMSHVSKEQLHEIGGLATELRSLDPMVQIISPLNEAQKLVTEIERIKKDLPDAGFFKKRGLKKSLAQKEGKYRELTENLTESLLTGYRKIYFDLANNIKEIAKFIPQETDNIRALQIPSFDPQQILNFSTNVLKTHSQISEILRGKNIAILVHNREILDLYTKFVDFDEEKIQVTRRTTKNAVHVMGVSDLLELYNHLETESAYLKQRRKGTEGKIQVAIIQMSSELQQHLDTVTSISLASELGDKINLLKDQVQEIKSNAEDSSSVESLILWEKGLNELNSEFLNSLRTYEISLKAETEERIGRILQISGKLGLESSLASAPEINVSTTDLSEIIRDIEKLRTWQQNQVLATRDLISTAALMNAGKTIKAMKIPIPEEFTKELRIIDKDAKNAQNMSTWMALVQRYFDLLAMLADACQQYFYRLLENPYIQEAINVSEGPQIPIIRDLKDFAPSELVAKAREIKDWETRLVAFFSKPAQQSLRQNLLNLLDSRESLQKLLSEPTTQQIETQRKQKSVEDKEIRELVREIDILTRLKSTIRTEILSAIDAEINPIYSQLTILETIPPKLKAHVPVLALDDLKAFRDGIAIAAEEGLPQLLDEYEKIPVWKYKIATRVRENLKAIPFPLIPIETRFDLREKRNEIIGNIDQLSEDGNMEAMIQEYIGFLRTIEEYKNEILVELKKQIENLEEVDKRLYRLLKSRRTSPTFSTEREFDVLDYSEALTEYWQLNAYIERRVAALTEQMEREIHSHIQDYSKLPPQYAEFFEEPISLMRERMEEIKTHKDIVQLVNIYESYSLESLQLAKNSLAKLHQNLHNWLRVSLPRINEIVPVDAAVFAAETKIADFEVEDVSHERLANKLRQLIFLYDTEIVAILLAQAVVESKKILKNVNDLKDMGISIISHVGGYIERFSQVLVKNQEDVNIKEITEVFTEIDSLQTDSAACREIRSMGDQIIQSINAAINYLAQYHNRNLSQDNRLDFSAIGVFQKLSSVTHVGHLTEALIRLNQVSRQVSDTIKVVEADRSIALQAELGQLKYYSSIQEVFSRFSEEASDSIYPLSELIKAREELTHSQSLKRILELLPFIDQKRVEWVKVSNQLNRWHRAIRMFRPRYTPTENPEENLRQYKDIKKKIKETYPQNNVIQAYLSLVMRLFIENKTSVNLD